MDLPMPAAHHGSTPPRRLIAAGFIRRLPGRVLTLRATQAGVTGTITKTARIAELHQLCAQDYARAAHRRTTPGQLLAAEPSGRRCPATFPTDPTPCRGPVAVTVLDKDNHGADGCEYHAGILLASLDGGRTYALPDAPAGAALRVFKAAGGAR
ncbi:hypothetical protein ACWC91_41010 [Streptomyces sp. NPDC001204]